MPETVVVQISAFEEAADMLRAMVPTDLGDLRLRANNWGLKAWFGTDKPTREHYEAQVVHPDAVRKAKVLAIEIGFHAEHPKLDDNDAVLAHLRKSEKRWRRVVGDEAEVGKFLGKADLWRRVSETWPDPDLGDEDLAVEIATRLTDYITGLEPVLRARK